MITTLHTSCHRYEGYKQPQKGEPFSTFTSSPLMALLFLGPLIPAGRLRLPSPGHSWLQQWIWQLPRSAPRSSGSHLLAVGKSRV